MSLLEFEGQLNPPARDVSAGPARGSFNFRCRFNGAAHCEATGRRDREVPRRSVSFPLQICWRSYEALGKRAIFVTDYPGS